MAESNVFTEEQIRQFQAQLRRMSLSGRILGVELEQHFKVDIFDQCH
jgi:hypothetical protein